MPEFSKLVLTWFACHGRKDLPWQENKNPYRIWLSEIMLQQTQVVTVIPYYLRFTSSFPNLNILSKASLDNVLEHWSGLGYYARARNLHKTSIYIKDHYDGHFPLDFDQLIDLPGIGRSTAGAILALSDNQIYPILDGNVKRVLARYHAIKGWPGKKKVEDQLWDIAKGHLPKINIANYTQAMMDLGATICTRSKPRCSSCPLKQTCLAHSLGEENLYPTKKKNTPKPHRVTYVILLRNEDKILMEKRPESGIWGGLYSLPELDNKDDLERWIKERADCYPSKVTFKEDIRHVFSHYSLDIKPIEVRIASSFSKVKLRAVESWVSKDSFDQLGLAAPIKRLIKSIK